METAEQVRLTLPVLGMSCAACQHHVEAALRATAGVAEARVDLMAHRATVRYDPAATAPETLVEAIRAAGYDAVLPRPGEQNELRAEEQSGTGRAWAMLAAGAAAMALEMPLGAEMGAFDHGLMRVLPGLYALPVTGLRWTLLAGTAAMVGWAGRGIYTSAWRALRHGTTNMNTLVGLGTGVAFLYSLWSTAWPGAGRAVYFDAVLLILGFLLLGKSLEGRAKQRARRALETLVRLKPAVARRVRAGEEKVVRLEKIVPGDAVRVLPGERFPADARILEGRTTVDESMLTGESTPLGRGPGERVLAGALNYDGSVLCRVESVGQGTVLEQIARMVDEAQGSRAPMERLADRASAIFVPVVLGVAAVTFVAWMVLGHSFEMALANLVAVLVVACPCAMGLAVPAALTVAVGRGAQMGVLFKGGEALERLARLDAVVLDKTGTLTEGKPALEAVRPVAGWQAEELVRLAAGAERQSNHPLAHAVVEAARARNLEIPQAEAVQNLPGRGLSARVEGRECLLGNEALFEEFFIALPQETERPAAGVTRLWMAVDGVAVGYFDARDRLRKDARAAVEELRAAGVRVLMLTGDAEEAAQPIAEEAGIEEVEAKLDPAGKLQRIRALQAEGLRVAMVGDGINDAAALAQADAGLAMGTGADLAQEAGDVLLLDARPGAIPAAIGLSRATVRVMRENLGWAAGYNLLGIPLAAGALYPAFHVLLSPWLAAAAMALSSICVLSNSLRLRGWRARGEEILSGTREARAAS